MRLGVGRPAGEGMGSFWAAGEELGAKALARVGLGLEQEREVPRCVTLISAFPGVGGV